MSTTEDEELNVGLRLARMSMLSADILTELQSLQTLHDSLHVDMQKAYRLSVSGVIQRKIIILEQIDGLRAIFMDLQGVKP